MAYDRFASLALCLLVAAGSSSADEGGESPQEVFRTLQSAAREGDSTVVVSQFPPSERCNYMVASILLVDKMAFASENAAELMKPNIRNYSARLRGLPAPGA